MVTITDILTLTLASAGVGFFVAGTLGLLRFPDVHCRLHALTKADNLGLGLIAVGLVLQTDNAWLAAKIVLVWLLTILAAATVSQLIARTALISAHDASSPRGQ